MPGDEILGKRRGGPAPEPGQRTSFSINGVVQANYKYNAEGQQVVRELTQAGQVIHAVHDMEGNRIAEYLYDTATGASTLIRQYMWMEGRAVAVVEG